jgi:hypothetical protein
MRYVCKRLLRQCRRRSCDALHYSKPPDSDPGDLPVVLIRRA